MEVDWKCAGCCVGSTFPSEIVIDEQKVSSQLGHNYTKETSQSQISKYQQICTLSCFSKLFVSDLRYMRP